MKGNDNVYKIIWKNGNKEYNEMYICCLFTIWNLKSAITCKCGRVVLSRASVYFAINKFILSFHILFRHHTLCFPTFVFTLYVPCFPFFLTDRNWKQVLLIKWLILFLKLNIIVLLFSSFWTWSSKHCSFNVDQRCETRSWKKQHCFIVV